MIQLVENPYADVVMMLHIHVCTNQLLSIEKSSTNVLKFFSVY